MLSTWRCPCDMASGSAQTHKPLIDGVRRWKRGCQQPCPVPMTCLAQSAPSPLPVWHGHAKTCWLQGQAFTAPFTTNKAPHRQGSPTQSDLQLRALFRQADIHIKKKSSAFLKVLTTPYCHCLPATTSALRESLTCSGSSHFNSSWFGICISSKFIQHFILINNNYTWRVKVSTKSIILECRRVFQEGGR